MASIHSRYLPWMLALTALFVLRVLAQAVQWVGPVPFLPSFDAWQGSALPYPLLLTTQVAIIALLARVLFLVRADAVRPASWKHNACFILGGAYFAVMAIRLVAGLTFPTSGSHEACPPSSTSSPSATSTESGVVRERDTVLEHSLLRSQLERSIALRQGESCWKPQVRLATGLSVAARMRRILVYSRSANSRKR